MEIHKIVKSLWCVNLGILQSTVFLEGRYTEAAVDKVDLASFYSTNKLPCLTGKW